MVWFKSIASVSTATSDAVAASLSARQQRAADMQARSCVLHDRIIGNICRHQEIRSGEYTTYFLFQRMTTMKLNEVIVILTSPRRCPSLCCWRISASKAGAMLVLRSIAFHDSQCQCHLSPHLPKSIPSQQSSCMKSQFNSMRWDCCCWASSGESSLLLASVEFVSKMS